MKANLHLIGSAGGLHIRIAAVSIALVCGSVLCPAQFNSPVGPTWDCVIGGNGHQGIALLTFSDESGSGGSFTGTLLLTGIKRNSSSSSNPRDPATDSDRDPSAPPVQEFLFGASAITDGVWAYDQKGRVTGFFSVPRQTGGTNVIHESISFVGKVVPGKRFNTVLSTAYGKMSSKGVPQMSVGDLSGNWIGTKKEQGQLFNELLLLTPFGVNDYDLIGDGPGYSVVNGICLVSTQRKIGFQVLELPYDSTNGLLRVTVGSINKTLTKAKTKGAKEPNEFVTLEIQRVP